MARKNPKDVAKKRAGAEHYDTEGMDPEMVGTLREQNVRQKAVGAMVGTDSSGTTIGDKIKKFFNRKKKK